jgi:peptidyl-prolyl cis-trans isomerase A (cyclophilin A)/peptidyl-prolyl cis-trans isomerase B (cyclophilin B)
MVAAAATAAGSTVQTTTKELPMYRRSLLILTAAASLAIAAAPVHAANPQVDLDTSAGRIRIELYPDAAPKTVDNFLAYVKAKHYDGTQFHRVIKGFMIQGGGYDVDFKEKPTKAPVRNEAEQSSKAGLLNVPGTIAMARTPDPHSATAQFFINVADNKALNFPSRDGYGYTVFGKVVDGMDVVNKIATTPTGSGGPFPTDVPAQRVLIKSATVVAPN